MLKSLKSLADGTLTIAPRHVELWVRPEPTHLYGCLKEAVRFTKKRRVVHGISRPLPKALRVTLHGIYARCAVNNEGKLKDGYKIVALPALPEDTEFFDGEEVLPDITRTIRRIVSSYRKHDYYWVPSKFSTNKVNFLLFAHKTTKLGSKIDDLSLEQKGRFYDNSTSIAQYGFQPYDRMIRDVQVRTFEEPNMTVKAKDFTKHMRKCVKSNPSLKTLWESIKDKTKSVPFGDGQLYIAPNSPVWNLAPEMANNQPIQRIESLKIISVCKGNPFVFLKGVIVRLSWREWRQKCRAAGVDPEEFEGILANQHSIKNKVKLALDKDIRFNIGYHSDSRQFPGRSQIFGSQSFLRSYNLTNPNAYWDSAEDMISEFERTTKAGDVKGFLQLVTGDPKVFNGNPYYRGMLGRALCGLPLNLLDSKMNPDKGMVETIKNMIIKRLFRISIPRSFRAHPTCKDHVFVHGKSMRLGINQVGLTPAQARKLKVSIGDSVVVIRSPKSAGYPNLVMKVISTKESNFSMNPVLYTIWNQGDFDGDSVAVYANDGIVKSKLKMVDILRILFEDEDDAFNHKIRQSTILSWFYTNTRHTLTKIKHSGLWKHVTGPYIQSILSKAATGAYDNLASKAMYAGLPHRLLRIFWNKITQLCITSMKHVGARIPHPYHLTAELRKSGIELGNLNDIHFLMSGNRDRFEEALTHTNRKGIADRRTDDPRSRRIIHSYLVMKPEKLLATEKPYSNAFQKNARTVLNKWIASLDSVTKEAVAKVIKIDGNSFTLRRVYGKYDRQYNLVAFTEIFNKMLNNPNGRTTNERFAIMSETITEIAGDNPQAISACWRAILNVAMFENFKSWLLTRDFDDATEAEICRLIREIAETTLRSMDVEPSNRIDTFSTEEDILSEVNINNEGETE